MQVPPCLLVFLLCHAVAVSARAAGDAVPRTYLCVDDTGHAYRMSQPLTAALTGFDCTEGVRPAALGAASAREESPPRHYAADPLLDAMRIPVVVSAPERRPPTLDVSRPSADALGPLIAASARRFGHDPLLLKAIIHVESAFKESAVSPKGAIGLMQIMPDTGRRFGVENPRRDLLGAALNIDVGARYLRVLRDLFGERLELAVAAYNAGEGAVMRHAYRIPPYAETQAYVQRVLNIYSAYRAGRSE